MPNILKPTSQENVDLSARQNVDLNLLYANHKTDRPDHDGFIDRNAELRLRLATIDNPEFDRTDFSDIDHVDTSKVVNLNTGRVTLKWLDAPGGVIKPKVFAGDTTYDASKDSYDAFVRQNDGKGQSAADAIQDKSRREPVKLTHPFMWTSDSKWCGMNYIPPVGSVAVVGFRKENEPVILGYMQDHYQVCDPLKPGEIMIKGYGNNYIHWRWSDKIDIVAKTTPGQVDIDDPAKAKTNEKSCTLLLRLNANDGYIKMSAITPEGGTALFLKHDGLQLTSVPIGQSDVEPNGSGYVQNPERMAFSVDGNSHFYQDRDRITTNIGGTSAFHQDGGTIELNIQDGTVMTHTNDTVKIKSSKVIWDVDTIDINASSVINVNGSQVNING